MAISATGAVTARDDSPDLQRRGPDAFAAELIGTLLLVFFIGAVVSINSADGLTTLDLIQNLETLDGVPQPGLGSFDDVPVQLPLSPGRPLAPP